MKNNWDERYQSKRNEDLWTWQSTGDILYMIWKYNLEPGKSLDLGCGVGEKSWLLSKFGYKVLGLDFSEYAINQAKQNFPELDFRVQDLEFIEDLQEKDFDLICDILVLAFIKDKEKYLNVIKTKLRGHFILKVPTISRKPNFIHESELKNLLKIFKILDEQVRVEENFEVRTFLLTK
jgi:SAM-dependent methyltransferase